MTKHSLKQILCETKILRTFLSGLMFILGTPLSVQCLSGVAAGTDCACLVVALVCISVICVCHTASTHVWCSEKVLQYYESQARSNNNRGREAACHCMAELVRKLESPAILPYLSRIMKALLSAFRDDSWPVSV